MRRLLRFIRAARLFYTHTSYTPPAPWTEADAVALHRFLATDTGAKLRTYLIAGVCEMNERAVLQATPHACGVALGYKAFWSRFAQLSEVPPIGDNGSDARGGDDAGLHFAP